MRALLLALALLPAAALAQPADEWTITSMLTDDFLPAALAHSETAFVDLRGEVFASRGPDTLWVSTYQPAGPDGGPLPIQVKVDHTPDSGVSQMLMTLPSETVGFGNQMFGMGREALDATFGASGLGWTRLENIDPEAGLALTEYHECPGPTGRAAIVVLRALPDRPGFSFFQLKLVRFAEVDCAS
ncbi:hypothetical protein [Rubrivirga sp. IMCC45206]|uniref:hypothetical protein n=1 Tax=Rubrivirga sp. IMCC45206 TaxID=3391614 RepID=UPI00398FB553